MPDFHQRATVHEQMDDPNCDPVKLAKTLDQFASINRLFSRVRAPLKTFLLPHLSPHQETHLLDLGAGACDIPVWLISEAEKQGKKLRVTAIDKDPRAVAHAQERYGDLPQLTIAEADAFNLDTFSPVDFVFGNHFLHHLPDDCVRDLLQKAHQTVRRGYLFSDLRRSRLSYHAFDLISRVYRNSFAREDGLISIRKGFTPEELQNLAPDPACKVQTRFPGRLLLSFLKNQYPPPSPH